MSFIAGTGKTNVDILYASLKRLPQLGEELYSDGFKLCLGGGVPGTMVNLGRLNIPVRTATWLGLDMFSDFASNEYRDNSVEITNLYEGGVHNVSNDNSGGPYICNLRPRRRRK